MSADVCSPDWESLLLSIEKQSIPGSQGNFVQRLRLLLSAKSNISTFAHEYDYCPGVKGNGYRSLIAIMDRFFNQMSCDLENGNFTLYPDLWHEYESMTKNLETCVKQAHIVRQKGNNIDVKAMEQQDLDFFHILSTSDIVSSAAASLGSSIAGFQYVPLVGHIVYSAIYTTMLYVQPVIESMKMLFSSDYWFQKLCHAATNPSLSLVQSLGSTGKIRRIAHIFNVISSFVTWTSFTRIEIPRSGNPFLIKWHDWESISRIENTNIKRKGSISCILVKPSGKSFKQNNSRKLLIHGHGGAFVIGSADIVVPKVMRLVKKIGIPVLIPDYGKAPQHVFPSATQDFVDVYLFLTTGPEEEIKDMIGYVPDQVFLSGQSAGANLLIGATFCLQEIRNLGHGVRMPAAIMTQYPCSIASLSALPSESFLPIDMMLPPGLLFLSSGMYLNIEGASASEGNDASIDEDNNNNIINKKNINNGDPWYRGKDAMEVVKRFSPSLKEPLVNLLVYKDFDQLKDIPLSIVVGQMDPLLDQAVLLARKWKGKVIMDIVNGMPHSFTDFWTLPSFQSSVAIYEEHIRHAVWNNGNDTVMT